MSNGGNKIDPEKLTPKEVIFCVEYVKQLNARAAALTAGYGATYAKTRATQILKRPRVIKEIERLRAAASASTSVTPADILRRIDKIARTSEDAKDSANALRALEMMGRHLGMFTDKHESRITVENPFKSGDDEETLSKDAGRLARIGMSVIKGGKSE